MYDLLTCYGSFHWLLYILLLEAFNYFLAPCMSSVSKTVDTADDHLEQVPTVQVNHGVKRKGKTNAGEGKRRRYEDLEEKNLLLDNKRLEEELHRVQEEREVLALKKEVLLLKKQKLFGEIQTLFPSFLAEL
uniref:Uncharacterized protein n=1 Tax=Magallana gigas TaxID=29159 RepID=A0A8W8MB63_MAGGI